MWQDQTHRQVCHLLNRHNISDILFIESKYRHVGSDVALEINQVCCAEEADDEGEEEMAVLQNLAPSQLPFLLWLFIIIYFLFQLCIDIILRLHRILIQNTWNEKVADYQADEV